MWQRSPAIVLAFLLAACGRTAPTIAGARALPEERMAELWIEPGSARDLYWGPGGRRLAPEQEAVYVELDRDMSGFSVSFDVSDPRSVEWSAKVGPEAQTEVAVSRVLWGVGYHQPPVYYLPSWRVRRGGEKPRLESEARFRPKLAELKPLDERWAWSSNPFLGTRQLNGLLVILLMLNSTDLKDDNNSVYELARPRDGARRWFVVRDLGAALGETGRLYPRRNWIEGFEAGGFITALPGDGRIEFDYRGRHGELLSMIRIEDVRWAADRLRRLTGRQWQDAFRAANYTEAHANRYIRRIQQKIDEGLALGGRGQAFREHGR